MDPCTVSFMLMQCACVIDIAFPDRGLLVAHKEWPPKLIVVCSRVCYAAAWKGRPPAHGEAGGTGGEQLKSEWARRERETVESPPSSAASSEPAAARKEEKAEPLS